ncbi:MAG TPA: pyridoxamine 5'-phosphate oxidase family protein [Myxococcota bacterium]|nr:pyridoxamine 5'-phosphate oxidase family protein [Myxococcota bacterium]
MDDDLNLEALIADLLGRNKTLKIATAGGPLSPWIGGAYYAERDLFALQVVLETHGNAMRNVQADERVAIMIAGDSPYAMFVQGEARAVIVDGDEAAAARSALLAKNPEMEPFFSFPLRHVRLDVRRWRVTDVPKGWIPAKELRAPA